MGYAYALSDIWHNEKIFRSENACKSENKVHALDPGNRKMMEGIKIEGNELLQPKEKRVGKGKNRELIVFYNETEQLTDWYDTAEECQEDCVSRCGMCGAWNYNIETGECKMHTSDACCGQKGNEVESS